LLDLGVCLFISARYCFFQRVTADGPAPEIAISSYYYQIKDKPANDNTHAMIKFIKQTAIEVGHTYGKRIVQMRLHSIAHLDRSETSMCWY
jgi:hypothetical protein